MQILIKYIWDGAWDSAFLTRSQKLLMLLVWGPRLWILMSQEAVKIRIFSPPASCLLWESLNERLGSLWFVSSCVKEKTRMTLNFNKWGRETAGLAQQEFWGKPLKSLLMIQVLPIFLSLHSSMWAFICMLVVLMYARWLLYLLASHLNSRPAKEWREGQVACLLRLLSVFLSLLCSLWDLNSWVGTEPGSSTVESRSLSCKSAREFPKAVFFKMLPRGAGS